MEPEKNNSNSKNIAVYSSIFAIFILGGFVFWSSNKKNEIKIKDESQSKNENSVPVVAENKKKYTDGVYSASGKYTSPAGPEEIVVTLTISDDKVVDAVFEGKATNPNSQKLQGAFSEGFKTVVVGKLIDKVSLTVVNGSSLTPKGFMDALEKIKAESEVKA